MSEPSNADRANLVGLPRDRTEPRERFDDIAAGLRLRSNDYGEGTVVAVLGIGIQVHWDTPILGTVNTHYLTHDKAYVAKLERL